MHVSERTEHCAACYGQYGDRRYVDFEAAYDGPVLEGAIKVAIDDLVICENCLTAAAKMIGLVKAPDLVKALDDERAKSHADHMKMGRLERQIKDLKAALAAEEPTPEEEPVAA